MRGQDGGRDSNTNARGQKEGERSEKHLQRRRSSACIQMCCRRIRKMNLNQPPGSAAGEVSPAAITLVFKI